jgi:4-aminobutyrate---pyruvate transaminase
VAPGSLKVYEEEELLNHVRAVAPHFAARIVELTSHPLVGHGRASGLVGAIELMADPGQKVPFDPAFKIGARVVEHALDYGLILRPLGDVISFCPPLIIKGAEIDFLFDAVSRALDRVAAEIGGGRRQVA